VAAALSAATRSAAESRVSTRSVSLARNARPNTHVATAGRASASNTAATTILALFPSGEGRDSRTARRVGDGPSSRPGRSADSATQTGSVSGNGWGTRPSSEGGKPEASPEWGSAGLPPMVNPTSIIPKSRTSAVEALFSRASGSDLLFRSHALRVAALSVRVGTAFGLSRPELETLELGAKLYDVGKLTVSRSILAKPGPLNDEEWAAMRRHPDEGARLLAPFVPSAGVLEIVRSHHERWDGAGYAEGLSGEEIPLGARIVAVVDAFCAMIEPRPYRPTLATEEARSELLAQAGRQFDPACAEHAHRLTGFAA
jgi:HD-GYP domain-containing protein (c-di-GMP phosphodiesterase class II)